MTAPLRCERIEDSIDALIDRVGKNIVMALPLGIGKPNAWINALYRRAKADPTLKLKIFTALSLDRPRGKSLLEQRFLEPFVKRVFGNYPDMDYSLDVKRGTLPPNVEICEFFLKTGEYLGNASAQSHYVYSNYTHAVRDALAQGVNVFAQAIAIEETPEGPRYSLSSNTDLTIDALHLANADGVTRLHMVGVVNREMPFMPNDAIISEEDIAILVDDPASTHTIFAPPNMKVDDQDYGIALYSSTTVKDGGTLQIGIGSLGDGIAHTLILRDRDNATYKAMLKALGGPLHAGHTYLEPFKQGLYGCSEMFVNGFMELIDAGIIRREVFDNIALQTLLNSGRIGLIPDETMLAALVDSRTIGSPISLADFNFMRHFGILQPDVRFEDGALVRGVEHLPATPADPAVRKEIAAKMLGPRLTNGRLMHGGFFIGPTHFYHRLRTMPRELLGKINMTRISFINQVMGQEQLAATHRRDARFINTTMMVTLLGAAVSDGLDTGNLVSGVGGQYNFVAMGHTLPDALSILMLRSWRIGKDGQPTSNIVWNYGHVTIPRHLRDVYITEYGVADVRGQSDAEVIKRLLAITDSRFQDELLARAKANGKIEADYQIPDSQRQNLPEVLSQRLAEFRQRGVLPDYPFGTDLDDTELAVAKALMKLKAQQKTPLALVGSLVRGLSATPRPELLKRLGLDDPKNLKEKVMRAMVAGNL
ncbi:acetyl-CoA hydrolase/transferase C-terminal domain-containing protein [Niveibacterium umoris]|uniref:Acyl-CoA hydrolase n=1 Tax=Niveibacterium umoris TaxID=1193620 RepID=A0A840BQH1_9RHOO|nr:acetyl-CoA hydrolase/transferase C-terminal domain-containing protein [Niveibacterium umoris]MBB4013719.1 acyl-CoA hydrolase [Niveibacterium umoris]